MQLMRLRSYERERDQSDGERSSRGSETKTDRKEERVKREGGLRYVQTR